MWIYGNVFYSGELKKSAFLCRDMVGENKSVFGESRRPSLL